MNICVAGWYFHKPLVEALSSHRTLWVCHRKPTVEQESSVFGGVVFEHVYIPNVGLEFGCYDWYLKNKWAGGDTLFLHDDNEITDEALDQIATIPYDQCFLFGNEEQATANGRAHGRAFFCSDKFLQRLKANGGFWYDEGYEPSGTIPATTADEPNYHNAGIQTFLAYLRTLTAEFSVNQVGIVPGLNTGYRGKVSTAGEAAPKLVSKAPAKPKINLCCGQNIISGYVNVDAWPAPGVDVVIDARELQYDEGSVDQVVMLHSIEHFTLDDACALIRKVFKWLKPGGAAIIEGPDVFKAVKNCPTGEFDAIRGIFGDIAEIRKGKDGYQHKWGWTGPLMQAEMASAGFNVSEVKDGVSHSPHEWRDYRIEGFKPKVVEHGV